MENDVIMLDEEQRGKLEEFSKNGVHNTHLIKRAEVILALLCKNQIKTLRY